MRLRAGTARSGLSSSTEAIFEGPRTRRAIAAWRRRQASPELIEQLKHGVKWPWKDGSPPAWCCKGNNPGCFEYHEWLTAVIEELVALKICRQVASRPWVVSPLNVVQKSGYDPVSNPFRLRLILDMRYVNRYMRAERFRMEALHRARCVFRQGDILLTIDMESGYWCMYVHDDHMMYMGFMWGGRYFVFVAMPFGAALAAFFFQRLTWTLSKWWRRRSGQAPKRAARDAEGNLRPAGCPKAAAAMQADPARHICYLDDFGWGVDFDKVAATSAFLLNEFNECGLRVNLAKSALPGHKDWPASGLNHQAVMLGILVDSYRMRFVIPETKRAKIVAGIQEALAAFNDNRPLAIRTVAKVVGRCMACFLVLGDAVRILTRFAYDLIARTTEVQSPPRARDLDDRSLLHFDYTDKSWRRMVRAAWNIEVHLCPDAAAELTALEEIFSHSDLESPIHPVAQLSRIFVTTDASDSAVGTSIDVGSGVRRFGRAELPPHLLQASSTSREIAGTEVGLEMFSFMLDAVLDSDNPLAYGQVVVFVDNKSAALALRLGSSNMDVHRRVQAVYQRAASLGIDILPRWRPRECQVVQEADDGSKWIDPCDFRLDAATFRRLDVWAASVLGGDSVGEFSEHAGDQGFPSWCEVDRFASTANHLLADYNAVLYAPNGNGGDAFVHDWGKQNNYLFPPFSLIGDAIAKLRADRGRGVLVVPFDTRHQWWPLVVRRHCNPNVIATRVLRRRRGLIRKAEVPVKEVAMTSLLAILLDYGL